MAIRRYIPLLTPSVLSGFISGISGVGLVLGVVVASRFQGSEIQQVFTDWNLSAKYQTVGDPYHAADINNGLSMVINTSITFLLWCILALAVMLLMYSVYDVSRSSSRFKHELEYMNLDKKTYLRQLAARLLLRISAVGALFVLVRLFLGDIIPYAVASSVFASGHVAFIDGIGRALLAIVAVTLSMQSMAILLRLALLKLRVFSRSTRD